MSWYCVLCCAHVMVLCFVLCTRHCPCQSWVLCVLVQGMVLHDQIENLWISLTLFFPHHLGITKIHMKIMGQHLVIFSIENPCISLTLLFPHHSGIIKIHMKIMGQRLVITSRCDALRDTVTLEEVPGVSEYMSDYLLLCQSA
jgi:hypothetical protein